MLFNNLDSNISFWKVGKHFQIEDELSKRHSTTVEVEGETNYGCAIVQPIANPISILWVVWLSD